MHIIRLTHVIGICAALACLTSMSVADATSTSPVNRDMSVVADDIGTLGGDYSTAAAINDDGLMVGTSNLADNTTRQATAAFLHRYDDLP